MKLNESNLADPLLLTGCALGGPPWGMGGSGGSFGQGQDLISTTTFPDDTLILPPTPSSGVSTSLSCKSSSPNGPTGLELDALLIVQSSDSFAELKPLPPFEFAANPGAQLTLHNDPHLPQMGSTGNSLPNQNHPSNNHNHRNHNNNNNNNNNHPASSNAPNNLRNGASGGSTGGSSIVSSPNGNFSSSSVGGSPSSLFDAVSSSTSVPVNIKSELADYLLNSDIDDIAALIGNAIADSTITVPNLGIELDPNGVTSSTIDPWTELDAWIESACQQQHPPGQVVTSNGPGGGGGGGGRGNPNGILLDQDATIHTSADHSFLDGTTSTLQTLLEADSFSGNNAAALFHHEMKAEFHSTSILQSRLQQPISGQLLRVPNNGGPNTSPSQMPESTTHYGLKVDPYTLDHPGSPTYIDPMTGEVTQRPHTTHVSPPVVTSSMMSNGNSKYRKQYKLSKSSPNSNGSYHDGGAFMSPYGNSSPFDHSHSGLGNQVSYATSSHIGPPWSHAHNHHWRKEQSKMGIKTKRKSSKMPTSSIEIDPLGKGKPTHYCPQCSRGFLNKSNIKVHLRTHTGEKPFKCDVCSKAFRQKAHLLKHAYIHKRVQRD